jgi:proteic killer suppression protein
MIKTAVKRTAHFIEGKREPAFQAFEQQARRRLKILDTAKTIEELMAFPSNRFEALRGDRNGQYSIRINNKWRICFNFENGDAFHVEITDYH